MRPAVLRAYRSACYEVERIECRIGRRGLATDCLLRSHGVQQAVFITAYNPRSRVMPDGWNRRMQARLLQALRRRPVLHGSGSWRRWTEAHLIVFGDAAPVLKLARRFRQNGVVIIRRGQATRLVILPGSGRWLCSERIAPPISPSRVTRQSAPCG